MSEKVKIRIVLVVLALAIAGYLSRNAIMRTYDAARLAGFARQIAETDRVVGGWDNSSVRLTFTNGDAKSIARAASSALSARMPNREFKCEYGANATFYKGTNVLGHIRIQSSLFLLDPSQPPFSSQLLDTTLYAPLLNALRESERNEIK